MLNPQQASPTKPQYAHQCSIRPQYINFETVMKLTTLCRSVIYKLIREEKFPEGEFIKGTTRKVWSLEEVEQFMNDSVQ